MWKDFPEALSHATGLGTFAYSRAGYGGSDPVEVPRPLDYMQREATNVLPGVLEAAGIERAIAIGHSDGASIAAAYAGLLANQRFCGLVLMAPHFFVEDAGVASIEAARHMFELGDLRAKLARYHGSNTDCAFKGWNQAWLDPRFRDWDIRHVLCHIQVPVLVIQGRQDEYGSAAQVDAARALCPGPVETLFLDDCGHAPFRDQRDVTLQAIANFTGKLILSL